MISSCNFKFVRLDVPCLVEGTYDLNLKELPEDTSTVIYLWIDSIKSKVTKEEANDLLEWIKRCPALLMVYIELGSKPSKIENLVPIFNYIKKVWIATDSKGFTEPFPLCEKVEWLKLGLSSSRWDTWNYIEKSFPNCRVLLIKRGNVNRLNLLDFKNLDSLDFFYYKPVDYCFKVPLIPKWVKYLSIQDFDPAPISDVRAKKPKLNEIHFDQSLNEAHMLVKLRISGNFADSIPEFILKNLRVLNLDTVNAINNLFFLKNHRT